MPLRRDLIRWVAVAACGIGATAGCGSDHGNTLEASLLARMAQTEHDVVGLYFRDLRGGDSLLVNPDVRMHAASMMKVPVMIQLYRDAESGSLDLDDSLTVTNTFASIVDGSAYELAAPDDSEGTLYDRLGRRESIRQLVELMITVSSNLATNILMELARGERVTATMRMLGADSIDVLRGVEDIQAYRAGLSNTTTARDLGIIFGALGEHRAAGAESCREMLQVLLRQQFNEGIPAGLPEGTLVAHKTGSITRIRHDGGIVFLGDEPAYVLVVLTRGIEEQDTADRLIADLSAIVHRHVGGTR